MTRQLTLDIGLRDHVRFDNFVVGTNRFLIQEIRSRIHQGGGRPVLFCGDVGTGKSHLLHAACADAHSRGLAASYVGLREARDGLPARLEGLAQLDLVCLDDVDCIGSLAQWERALFNLYNESEAAAQCSLLMSATLRPEAVGFVLPDLTSRLGAALVGTLGPVTDEQRTLVLSSRAQRRGLNIGTEVIDYMLRHLPRDMHSLVAIIDALDMHSLERKRRITVPLLRDWLELSGRTER